MRHAIKKSPKARLRDPIYLILAAAFSLVLFFADERAAWADGSGDPKAVSSDNGKYIDKEGNPTYNIGADGTVDWYTYSGFRRYHSECHVCHGPDGEGSTYAPALKKSLDSLSYAEFAGIVASGRKRVDAADNSVMPAFEDNINVSCYLDDFYVYLRARANEAVPRGRPQKREEKPEEAKRAETACLGTPH